MVHPSILDVEDLSPQAPERRMPEEEFVAWAMANEVRAEWVNGEVILMSPAALKQHRMRFARLRRKTDCRPRHKQSGAVNFEDWGCIDLTDRKAKPRSTKPGASVRGFCPS